MKTYKISLSNTNNAFPAIALDKKNRIWVAWSSCKRRADDIYARFIENDALSNLFKVSDESGINFKPTMATDVNGRLWICWASRREGNWSIYGRYTDGIEWSNEIKITSSITSDSMPILAADNDGKLWLAYESFSNGRQNICVKVYDGKKWLPSIQVSDKGIFPEYNYRPSICVDPYNRVFIAWDAYRSGRYTILMRFYDGKSWSEIIEVPGDNGLNRYHPHLAADRFGNIWISYVEQGEMPDYEVFSERRIREMGPKSKIYLICWTNMGWCQTLGDLPQGMISKHGHFPFTIIDRHDRPWIFWQQLPTHMDWFFVSRFYQGKWWSDIMRYEYIEFPDRDFETHGMDFRGNAVLDSEGNIWLVHEEGPPFDDRHIYVRRIEDTQKEPISFLPHLVRLEFRSPSNIQKAERWWGKFTIKVRDEVYIICKGNLHVQTLLSDGHSGTPDQFYTLGKEFYGWDFAAITDHCDSYKWIQSEFADIQRIASIFNYPGTFVGISGYEWTQGDFAEEIGRTRQGHRCILYETDDQPFFSPADRSARDIFELSEALKRTSGLMFAHHLTRIHSGGTDFSYYIPEVEPVIEICSEWGIFEYLGNPGKIMAHGGKEVTGCSVQDALVMGLKLGFIAGSDSHDFCHLPNIGLTFALVKELSRKEIFAALRNRRTYASTGQEIFINFQLNDHIMGEEIKINGKEENKPRKVYCEVMAPDKIARIDIIRNNEVVYSQKIGNNHVIFDWIDYENLSKIAFTSRYSPQPTVFYYVRVQQEGALGRFPKIAWASPIWITLTSSPSLRY
ncbi:MAG: hypothetical protein QXR45_09660 [Candidatus Bathyarchaeia archaeon]